MARPIAAVLVALAFLLAAAPPAQADGGWVWPLHGEVVTSYRNLGDPYAAGQHRGIDIAASVGAPVAAARGGVVRFAGNVGYSGLTVGVRTADGRYDTSYLHLSSLAVHAGQRVSAGQRLGAVGTTGHRSATRPHLHFGVRDAGSRHGYHDPLDLLPPPARPRPAPRGTPTPVGAPARPSPAPHPHSPPGPEPASRPAPQPSVPEAGPSPVPDPAARPVPAPRRPGDPARGGDAHGPGLGWALLCLGLLVAAALAGAGSARPGSARGVPARVGAWLRPLTGRG